MKKYFLDLFEYNNWANDKILLTLQKYDGKINNARPIILFGHIISFQETWLERVLGRSSYNIYLWDEYSIPELFILSENNHKDWIKFLNKLNNEKFEKKISINKLESQNPIRVMDVLNNVLFHSNYHRGQINQILKSQGVTPPTIDFINYC